MKTNILLLAGTAILMTISIVGFTQPGPPPPPRQRPARERLQEVTAYNGQFVSWVNNDDFVYDGFYLQSGGEKLLSKFPAHMGSQLKAFIKTGSTVTVNGVADISPSGEKEIRMVSITAGGQTLYDTPPAPPANPPAEEFVNGSSKIAGLQKNQRSDVNGFLLDNKTILRVPRHVISQLSQVAVAGATVSYTGIKKAVKNGEVSSGNYTIVHCETITINGTQYLTR